MAGVVAGSLVWGGAADRPAIGSTASSIPPAIAAPAVAPPSPDVDLDSLLLSFPGLGGTGGGKLAPPDGDIAVVLLCSRSVNQDGKLREAKARLTAPPAEKYHLPTHVALFEPGAPQRS